jgi:outer membrane lipoprotein-sorting protein
MSNDSRADDLLEVAVRALRQTPVPDGPPAEVLAAAAAAGAAARSRPWASARQVVGRFAVAAALVAGVGLAVHYLGLFGRSVAFADVAAHFQHARTVYFRYTAQVEGQPPMVMKYTLAAPSAARVRTSAPKDQILIFDHARGEGLMLLPESKQAVKLTSADKLPGGAAPVAEMIRSLQEFAHDTVDDLGPRQIDGKPAVGFRVRKAMLDYSVWADPKTKLPLRVETTVAEPGLKATAVLDEFAFDAELDPTLFSLVPPQGYTVIGQVEYAAPFEQDLTYFLGEAAKHNHGVFPDAVDLKAMLLFKEEHGGKDQPERLATTTKLVRAMVQVQILQKQGAWRYAGRGVRPGDAGKIIAVWKYPGEAGWKAVYGDLSVRGVPEATALDVGK